MIEISLKQSVNAQWHGIAEVAAQIRSLLQANRTKVRSRDEQIARVGQMIETIDGLIEIRAELLAQHDRNGAHLAELGPEIAAKAPLSPAEFAEVRQTLLDQEVILLATREQLMAFIYQLTPEDAWVWRTENLAALRRAKADAAAGRVTHFHSDDEFLGHLDSLIAEDAHA